MRKKLLIVVQVHDLAFVYQTHCFWIIKCWNLLHAGVGSTNLIMWPISNCKSQKFMTHKLKIIANPYFLHLMLCTFQHLCHKEAMWTMFWRPRQKRTFITFLWSWHSGSKCANKFVCYSADNKKMEKYLLNRISYILWLVEVEQDIVVYI